MIFPYLRYPVQQAGQLVHVYRPVVPVEDEAGDFVILGHASCLEFFAATFDGDRKILTMLPNRDFPGTIG
ncbi:MAG: hypothetical protein WBF93_13555 [Pirellulales bacterium]